MSTSKLASLGIAVVLCMMGQVTTALPPCGVDSRPHSGGICGDKLIETRDRFCYLLISDYPGYFTASAGKRSTNIFDLPMEAFAKMLLQEDDSPEVEEEFHFSPKVKFPFMPSKTQTSDRGLMSKRGGVREMTSVEKRGLICDCCYNECLPSILGQYC